MSVDRDTVRRLALAMPEATEADHHGIPSFRVGKSIGSRTEADNLATRLRGSTTNLEPRVMKQQ